MMRLVSSFLLCFLVHGIHGIGSYKYYYKRIGNGFDIILAQQPFGDYRELKPPKMHKVDFEKRGERPGVCYRGHFICSVPYQRSATQHFECTLDYQCPRFHKCCKPVCFAHKVCQPAYAMDFTSTSLPSITTDGSKTSISTVSPDTSTEEPPEPTTKEPSATTTQESPEPTTELPPEPFTEVPLEPTTAEPPRSTTEVSHEPTTEVPFEPTTKVPTTRKESPEPTTGLPPESTTEVPTEPTTVMTSETTTEVPSATTTKEPAEPTTELPPNTTSTEVPPEPSTQVPSEPTTQVPSEPTTQVPSEPTTEVPSEPTTAVPPDTTTEVQPEPTTQVPSEPTTGVPSAITTKKPLEPTTELPSKTTTEVPLEPTTEVPSTTTTKKPLEPTTELPPYTTSTEVPPEPTTEMSSEPTRAIPPHTTTEVPPEHTTQVPSGPTTEVPSATTTRKPLGPTTELPPYTTSTEVPSEPSTQMPSEPTSAVPPHTTTEVPPEHTTQVPSGHTTEVPSAITTKEPPEPSTEIPPKPPTDLPPEHTTKVPSEPTSDIFSDSTTEEPPDPEPQRFIENILRNANKETIDQTTHGIIESNVTKPSNATMNITTEVKGKIGLEVVTKETPNFGSQKNKDAFTNTDVGITKEFIKQKSAATTELPAFTNVTTLSRTREEKNNEITTQKSSGAGPRTNISSETLVEKIDEGVTMVTNEEPGELIANVTIYPSTVTNKKVTSKLSEQEQEVTNFTIGASTEEAKEINTEMRKPERKYSESNISTGTQGKGTTQQISHISKATTIFNSKNFPEPETSPKSSETATEFEDSVDREVEHYSGSFKTTTITNINESTGTEPLLNITRSTSAVTKAMTGAHIDSDISELPGEIKIDINTNKSSEPEPSVEITINPSTETKIHFMTTISIIPSITSLKPKYVATSVIENKTDIDVNEDTEKTEGDGGTTELTINGGSSDVTDEIARKMEEPPIPKLHGISQNTVSWTPSWVTRNLIDSNFLATVTQISTNPTTQLKTISEISTQNISIMAGSSTDSTTESLNVSTEALTSIPPLPEHFESNTTSPQIETIKDQDDNEELSISLPSTRHSEVNTSTAEPTQATHTSHTAADIIEAFRKTTTSTTISSLYKTVDQISSISVNASMGLEENNTEATETLEVTLPTTENMARNVVSISPEIPSVDDSIESTDQTPSVGGKEYVNQPSRVKVDERGKISEQDERSNVKENASKAEGQSTKMEVDERKKSTNQTIFPSDDEDLVGSGDDGSGDDGRGGSGDSFSGDGEM